MGHDGLRNPTLRARSSTALRAILSWDDSDVVPIGKIVLGTPAAGSDLAIVDHNYLRFELAKSWRFYMRKRRGRSKVSGKARESVLSYDARRRLPR